MRRRIACVLLVCICVLGSIIACGDPAPSSKPMFKDGAANVAVVYSDSAGLGIKTAADELVRALGEMGGKAFPAAKALKTGQGLGDIKEEIVILVGRGVLDDEPITDEDTQDLGDEGYMYYGKSASGKQVFQIAGNTEGAHQYGVYALLRQFGARYFHPADTYVPRNIGEDKLTLKFGEKITDTPKFALRGFHHHTQHPIPMSVYLLEPDDAHLPKVREYLLWLCRNRQNLLQWHFLKTVDIDKWLPYIKKVSEMAALYGVKLGLTISFADQQQNNYRLVDDLKMSTEEQNKAIKERIDKLAQGGFQVFVFQFGTSEFTKVKDEVAINWLDVASTHVASKGLKAYAWIHIAGELYADDGKSYFYHLPEKSKSTMGAYVHTTMFYDMKNPAPVYSNEDFTHQAKFMDRVLGKRDVVFFPESAWWLGFDNNMPLALPLTGYSRALDILELMKGKDAVGHVTFTTGMEWGYWKYDHYLTRVTWDRKTTWPEYIKDFAATFEGSAKVVEDALNNFTELQRKNFYDINPLLYFYLAGELPQDELGQQVGVLARRPKRAFNEIINLKADEYSKWEKEDFAQLQKMLTDYEAIFKTLPDKIEASDNAVAKKLYNELHTTMKLYLWRLQHTIMLYDAVREARKGRVDGGVGAVSDKAAQDAARAKAKELIDKANTLTGQVVNEIDRISKEVYRYPARILYEERPSLTSYQFGYLWETQTGFFWKRRVEQAQKLLKKVSGELKEEWTKPDPVAVYLAPPKSADGKEDNIAITEPDAALIGQVLKSFIPGFAVAVTDTKVADGDVSQPWRIALDNNDNKKPDADTVAEVAEGKIGADGADVAFTGKIKLFSLPVIDQAGNDLGQVGLHDVELKFVLDREGDTLKGIKSGTLRASIILDNLAAVATQISGLDKDGLYQILGSILKFDPKNPPRSMKVTIAFKSFEAVPATPAP